MTLAIIQALGLLLLTFGFGFVAGVVVEHHRLRRIPLEEVADEAKPWQLRLGQDIETVMDKLIDAQRFSGMQAQGPFSFRAKGRAWNVLLEERATIERIMGQEKARGL